MHSHFHTLKNCPRSRSIKSLQGYGLECSFSFNGKENDNEVKGDGNQQDYGMRIYDNRTGKFLSVDPLTKEYPELTPFQFASNNPIENIDLDGLEGTPAGKDYSGYIRNATEAEWDYNPVFAALKDVSAFFLNGLSPFGAIDDAHETFTNPSSTPSEKVIATVNVALSSVTLKGKPSEPLKLNSTKLKVTVAPENKIPRTELVPPKKPGNAPTFKEDGSSVEIHHVGQKPEGPFKEMHKDDHRGKGNDKVNHPDKGKQSKVDRKEFQKAKAEYWKTEFPTEMPSTSSQNK
jgi:RHS repeat-associated protein